MSNTELKLEQIEGYAWSRLDVDAKEIAAEIGCSTETAEHYLRTLVDRKQFVLRADCYAIAYAVPPLHSRFAA